MITIRQQTARAAASIFTALVALSSAALAAQAAPAPQATAAAQPPPQALPKVCVDVQTSDSLTHEFANRLKDRIEASGALALAPGNDSCTLQLHVPGNLLRFQTEGGVMVSTVVIVTSASGRYLSSSITACRANELEPCAVRAVAVAKLALLMSE